MNFIDGIAALFALAVAVCFLIIRAILAHRKNKRLAAQTAPSLNKESHMNIFQKLVAATDIELVNAAGVVGRVIKAGEEIAEKDLGFAEGEVATLYSHLVTFVPIKPFLRAAAAPAPESSTAVTFGGIS